ncbi:MAG: type VI secretion system accessory protein TagJ [Verrucomicrobiota bacterium]
MTAQELVRLGDLPQALQALQEQIKRQPDDPKLRVFLFQLNCVLGRFDKALTQLQVMASLDAELALLAQIFRPVITCEALRAEVFAGKRTALIFGEPTEWIGWLVQAAALAAQGQVAAATELQQRAFEAAPATPGTIDGQSFDWIADADSRLGPLLEVILDGKYYWIPFCRIVRMEIEKPTDLRDLVWIPVRFTWTNGGAATGHVPARYPNTEHAPEDALRLARKTLWQELGPDYYVGCGQRVLTANVGEFPVLDCRRLEMAAT